MINCHTFQNGKAKVCGLGDLRTKNMVWVDCIEPTHQDLLSLSELGEISLDILKEAVDEEERPKLVDIDNYTLIIFRAPIIDKDEIETTPVAILISKTKNNLITLRKKDIPAINKLKLPLNYKNLFDKGIGYSLYRILDEIINTYFAIMDNLGESIDSLEDKALGSVEKSTVEEIFTTKKILIYFYRALSANREVLIAVQKEYGSHISKKDLRKMGILYDDIVQLLDTVATYRDILTSTLDIYLSSVSNNLNQVMKTLTLISAFVLIPTLISGIYGMNFKALPELNWRYGYYFALGLMILSISAMFVFFKKKKYI